MSERTSTTINEPHVVAALQIFSENKYIDKRVLLLKSDKGGAVHSVCDDPRFTQAIDNISSQITSENDANSKFLALAIIERVASRIRSKRESLGTVLAEALRVPFPKLSVLVDADDRAYAAQALRWASGDWIVPYLGCSIVEEEAGEKARSELVRVLLVGQG